MKVALYMRVANANQLEPSAQIHPLERYARENGHEVVKRIEEACSGLSCDRPGLNELLTIPSDDVQGVLTMNMSRIGRSPLLAAQWQSKLEASGKELISLDGGEANSDLHINMLRHYKRSYKKSKKR